MSVISEKDENAGQDKVKGMVEQREAFCVATMHRALREGLGRHNKPIVLVVLCCLLVFKLSLG